MTTWVGSDQEDVFNKVMSFDGAEKKRSYGVSVVTDLKIDFYLLANLINLPFFFMINSTVGRESLSMSPEQL